MVRELAKFQGAPIERYLRSRLTPAAAKRVTITGAVLRTELLGRYRDFDLSVLPSIYPEGFGTPIVEGSAAGCPRWQHAEAACPKSSSTARRGAWLKRAIRGAARRHGRSAEG
jgi:glycosyltransferase involved in cell wall biosynthesis